MFNFDFLIKLAEAKKKKKCSELISININYIFGHENRISEKLGRSVFFYVKYPRGYEICFVCECSADEISWTEKISWDFIGGTFTNKTNLVTSRIFYIEKYWASQFFWNPIFVVKYIVVINTFFKVNSVLQTTLHWSSSWLLSTQERFVGLVV